MTCGACTGTSATASMLFGGAKKKKASPTKKKKSSPGKKKVSASKKAKKSAKRR